jgi:hypothetical protein
MPVISKTDSNSRTTPKLLSAAFHISEMVGEPTVWEGVATSIKFDRALVYFLDL